MAGVAARILGKVAQSIEGISVKRHGLQRHKLFISQLI